MVSLKEGLIDDATSCFARRSMGADQRSAAAACGVSGRHGEGQSAVCRRGSLPLASWDTRARPAGAVRRLPGCPYPLQPVVQEWRLGADFLLLWPATPVMNTR